MLSGAESKAQSIGQVPTHVSAKVDFMVDSGAETMVCGLLDFPEVLVTIAGPAVRFRRAQGNLLKWHGRKRVRFEVDGEKLYRMFTNHITIKLSDGHKKNETGDNLCWREGCKTAYQGS